MAWWITTEALRGKWRFLAFFSYVDPFSKFDLNCFLTWVYYFLQLSLLSFAMIIFKFLNIFSTCENTWIKVFYVWNMKKKKSAEFCSFSHVKTFSWNTMMKLWKIINFLFFLLKMFFLVSHMEKNESGFFFSPNFRNSFHWEKEKVLSMKPKRNSGFILDWECSKKVWTFIFSQKNFAWHIPGGKKRNQKEWF